MKASGGQAVPTGRWSCEIKFDGYRAIAVLNGGKAELWSRNEKELSADFAEIVAALAKLKCRSATLDGEIVALDAEGRSHFQLLQGRADTNGGAPLVFYAFDLLTLNGKSWMEAPLEARRGKLVALMGRAKSPLRLSPVFDVEPAELLAAARDKGLEGIIAKRPGSRYENGRRSTAWVKCKVVAEQEFVIGGFTHPQNSREYFGAILVGYYRAGKLIYAGKVGTGFDRARLRSLHAKFAERARADCGFTDLPRKKKPRFGAGMTRTAMRTVTWIEPELVAQVKFAEWTADGLLRQPVFLGLREDKRAKSVRREAMLRPNSAG